MYRKNEAKWMKHWDFLLLDVLCCWLSFVVAYNIRGVANDDMYRATTFVLLIIDIAVIFFVEPFSKVLKRGYLKELRVTILHVLEVVLGLLSYMFTIKLGAEHSRLATFYFVIIYLLSSYTTRLILKKYILNSAKYAIKMSNKSLLVLTEQKYLEKSIEDILNNNLERYRVSGICVLDKQMKGESINDIPIVSNKKEVLDYVCREWVDEVLIISKNTEPYEDLIVGFTEMGITLHVKINFNEGIISNSNTVDHVGPYLCLTSSIRMANNYQLFLKRLMDIVGGIVGCLITLVLMIIFYPIVQIKSPGPLIYVSERIGKNGKKFKFYKFRSMVTNADALKKDLEKQNFMSDGMMFKVENDPRIIPGYGEFIRKTSLDEFPQFWNVLKGDMSLVGTRPPTPDEWEKYKLHHRVRLSSKPGITGMWQASGRSNITDFEEVVKLDSYYVRNWDLGLDIKLLLLTVKEVLFRKGSM